MRIDPKSNIESIYEANTKKNSSALENNVNQEDKLNKDRVEISKTARSFDELSPIKEKVVADVEKATSPDRLRELKAQIENGTYHVSSQDIAAAILNIGGKNPQDTENE